MGQSRLLSVARMSPLLLLLPPCLSVALPPRVVKTQHGRFLLGEDGKLLPYDEALQALQDQLGELSELPNTVNEQAEGLVTSFNEGVSSIGESISETVNQLGESPSAVNEQAEGLLSSFNEGVSGISDSLSETVNQLTESIGGERLSEAKEKTEEWKETLNKGATWISNTLG